MKLLSCLVLLAALGWPAPSIARQPGRWPLPDGAKSRSKALQIPTTLTPIDRSLTDLLNQGGRIVGSSIGPVGPVVTVMLRRKSIVCLVTAQDPATDQNVATSECYSLN